MKATCIRLKKEKCGRKMNMEQCVKLAKEKATGIKARARAEKAHGRATVGKEKDNRMEKAKEKGSKAVAIIAVKQDILPDCAPTATLKEGHPMEKVLEITHHISQIPSVEIVTHVEQKVTKPVNVRKEKDMANRKATVTVEKVGKEAKEDGTMKYQAPPQTGKGEKLAY